MVCLRLVKLVWFSCISFHSCLYAGLENFQMNFTHFRKKHRMSMKWWYFPKFIEQQPSVSNNKQSSHSLTVQSACIMPKKCLLMKWAPFIGIICCWWRLYLNWQTGSLPKAMLLFFFPFLSLNSYLKDMKETFLPLTILLIFFFNCNLIARVWNNHLNDFIIFSFHGWDSFPEKTSWSQITIHSPEYHNIMSMKWKH